MNIINTKVQMDPSESLNNIDKINKLLNQLKSLKIFNKI